MRVRFSGTPPNFFLAFLVAPFAGALTAILLAAVMLLASAEVGMSRFSDWMASAAFLGIYALVICAMFTTAIGVCVVMYVELSGHIPSLPSALAIGFLVAVSVFLLLEDIDRISLGYAAFAGMCSLTTAWSFWWLGLRGRRADD